MTRVRNPRGEGAKLREQLLAATAELINEVGDADKVSVRAIARRAGVSPTALYLQFPDRDSLVAAAVDAGFDTFNRELLAAAAVAGAPRERLLAMGHAYLEFSERRPALYAILFSARRPSLDKSGEVDPDLALEGVIQLLQAQNPRLDHDTACDQAILIWSSLHGYAMLRTVRPHLVWPSADAYLAQLLSMFSA